MGSEINIFLASVSTGTYVYGVDSREEITIEPNVVENDKEYMVCATTKPRIKLAVTQSPRKRKSPLSPASIATTDMNTTTQLRKMFAKADDNTVEVHTVFKDDVEEERERDEE